MFNGAISFNSDISLWDTSNVTTMSSMFYKASSFNQDIGNWNVSKVTSMARMFNEADVFNQYIGNWKTSNVTSMQGMFIDSKDFNQDIGRWDTTNLTEINGMFKNATSFNQDIGLWDVSNVTEMEEMFKSASSFNKNISSWCVTKILSEPTDFSTDSPLEDLYKPQWGSCPSNELIVSGLLTPYSQTVESKWILVGIDFFPGTKVRVFDKNGYLVYGSENYNNDWGGLNNDGKILPAGSYYYIIIKPDQTTMNGWLFLTY